MTLTALEPTTIEQPLRPRLAGHVVVVTNFIAAHRAPLYRAIAARVEKLTILLSTPMEANRRWQPDWQGLNVQVQRTTTVPQVLKHRSGFNDLTYVHIPWDTLTQLRKLQPDVLVSAELGMRTLFSAAYKTFFRRVPLVYWVGLSEHTEKNKGGVRHFLRKRLLPRADAIIVNGESGTRYLQQMGTPSEKIHRLYYSCHPNRFDLGPATRPEAISHRLLFVGQLIERKGILHLLSALADWGKNHPARNVELVIAGSGELRPQVEAFPLPDNVQLEMLGQCNYDQLVSAYANAGIFAFPSFSDDWGISVNEALTSGLPVLGSIYSQAVDELCIEGETGWRFRVDHPKEVADALETALDTPHERLNDMRVAARRQLKNFNPDFAAEQFLAALVAAKAKY